jgi:hypothetical protein
MDPLPRRTIVNPLSHRRQIDFQVSTIGQLENAGPSEVILPEKKAPLPKNLSVINEDEKICSTGESLEDVQKRLDQLNLQPQKKLGEDSFRDSMANLGDDGNDISETYIDIDEGSEKKDIVLKFEHKTKKDEVSESDGA